jgi:TM2 domain-containing membrane protein YozV
VIFWLLPIAGLPYFYLGQTGKGLILLLLDLLVVGPLIVFTCGLAWPFVLAVYIPVHILILVDSILVAGRMRKGPVSSWRFF